jgi:4-amino-4-deoxy-L-arabinose transferase-like glycosyltransferase
MPKLRRLPVLAGLAVLLLAALLRAPSLTAARPYINYVDEGNYLHPVVHMLRAGGWDPRSYGYPQLPGTLTAAASRLYAPLHPRFHEGRTFQQDLSTGRKFYDLLEPFELLFAARFLSFLAGLGIVVLTGLYGRRLLGTPAGLFAMFLAAWVPSLVIRGSIATVDPWAALFALACFFFADRLRTSGRPGREAFLAGAMAGLAFASKYPAVLVACGAGLIVLLDERPFRDKFRWLMIGAAGILAGMVAGMPALVLHPHDVVLAIRNQNELYTNLPPTPRLWEQAILRAEWDLPYDHPELGIPFLLLAAAGAGVALRDRRLAKTVAGWLLFIAVGLVLYVPKSFQAFRNLLPYVPLLCLLVAVLYARIRERLARPLWAPVVIDLGAALVVLALFGAPVARWSWQRSEYADSRRQAMDWLTEHSGPKDSVLVLRELELVRNELLRLHGTVVHRRLPGALSAIRSRRPHYLVLGKLEEKGSPTLDLAQHPAVLRGYVLRSSYGSVATPFHSGWWKGNHQVVYVFERKGGRGKGKRPLSAGDRHGGRGADGIRGRGRRAAAGV